MDWKARRAERAGVKAAREIWQAGEAVGSGAGEEECRDESDNVIQ